ncbi:MAG: major capsid protein DJR [Asgard archaea virus SkuldV2]|nr:MAG: major capsid protein DJR [Asgard archaea virus SkuldV2]
MNKLRQGVVETDDYFNIILPQAFPAGHNAYVDFKFRAVADLQTGVSEDTFTGAVVDVFMDKTPQKKALDFQINSGKFTYGANAGNIANFLNPSRVGFKCAFLMVLAEDSGTPGEAKILKITIKKGTDILQEGSIDDYRVKTLAKNHIATGTGFAKIPVGKPIGSNDLQLIAYIPVAGTAVDLHWLMIQMR